MGFIGSMDRETPVKKTGVLAVNCIGDQHEIALYLGTKEGIWKT